MIAGDSLAKATRLSLRCSWLPPRRRPAGMRSARAAGIHLIIEYDGRQHAFDIDQWRSDVTRREELDELGLRIVVVESNGIYVEPLRTLERIRAALRERGVRVPTAFRAEWTRRFAAAV